MSSAVEVMPTGQTVPTGNDDKAGGAEKRRKSETSCTEKPQGYRGLMYECNIYCALYHRGTGGVIRELRHSGESVSSTAEQLQSLVGVRISSTVQSRHFVLLHMRDFPGIGRDVFRQQSIVEMEDSLF